MDEIESKFALALEGKTGWGKNEVLELYRSISKEVYLKKLSQMMDRN